MAYVIAEPCIDHMDQLCVAVCPVDCIQSDLSYDRKFFIDPDNCTDCGACVPVCPNQAIFHRDQLPQKWADFAWADAMWYIDPNAARGVIEEFVPAA